jgi:hypothetical protein
MRFLNFYTHAQVTSCVFECWICLHCTKSASSSLPRRSLSTLRNAEWQRFRSDFSTNTKHCVLTLNLWIQNQVQRNTNNEHADGLNAHWNACSVSFVTDALLFPLAVAGKLPRGRSLHSPRTRDPVASLPVWSSSSRVLVEKLIVAQLVKKFTAYYGTPSFITVFTRNRHWSLSWARWIQSTPSHSL